MTTAFTELRAAEVSVQKSCLLTGISRATHYRHATPKAPLHGPRLPRTPPPSALTPGERAAVPDLLASPAYQDLAIPQVWARELDEGRYLPAPLDPDEDGDGHADRDVTKYTDKAVHFPPPPAVCPALRRRIAHDGFALFSALQS